MNPIRINRTYPHSPSAVWQALTDAAAVAKWFLPSNLEPVVGHRFEFQDTPKPGFDGRIRCQVLEVVPERLFVYSWQGGPLKHPTTVRFELHPTAGGTELRFEHAGFTGFSGGLIRAILGLGWRYNLLSKKLPHYLDHAYGRIQSAG